MNIDELLDRVRGEFREMPGLRLTVPQAQRLWHLDESTCMAVLEHLREQSLLWRTRDGAYIADPDVQPRPARATLTPGRHRRTG